LAKEFLVFSKLTTNLFLICSQTLISGAFVVTAGSIANAQSHPRPRITGISHIAVYTTDMQAADHYYSTLLGAASEPDPEDPKGRRYAINATQFVEVIPAHPCTGLCPELVDHIGYKTDNAEGLRLYLADKGYLANKGFEILDKIQTLSDGSKTFRVLDPESNLVEFVEPPPNAKAPDEPSVIGRHIIHVGFLVHSRETEDKFYKDLLGFKPYWFGGMEEGKIDWVSQQTPDGHDWLEYMLTSGPSGSGIPSNISQRSLGVLDHLSIGVVSVPEAYKTLSSQNRLPSPGDRSGAGLMRADKQPNIGKDGKYQFNLYDPEGVRTELMEFKAIQKPCCSPFTADDPTP
jgi:catechol 2,3-dioxygenase-like lactoylglutathione lyase family enzyme